MSLKIKVFLIVIMSVALANANWMIQIEGVVTNITEMGGYSFDESINMGTTFVETYYFNNIDTDPDPERGSYIAYNSILNIGNYEFTSYTGGLYIRAVEGDSSYNISSAWESNGLVYINGQNYEYSSIDWVYHASNTNLESSTGVPDTDQFPIPFPDESIFDIIKFWQFSSYFYYEPDNPNALNGIYLAGEITSIVTVPEPCSILLFGIGGLLVLRRRKKS